MNERLYEYMVSQPSIIPSTNIRKHTYGNNYSTTSRPLPDSTQACLENLYPNYRSYRDESYEYSGHTSPIQNLNSNQSKSFQNQNQYYLHSDSYYASRRYDNSSLVNVHPLDYAPQNVYVTQSNPVHKNQSSENFYYINGKNTASTNFIKKTVNPSLKQIGGIKYRMETKVGQSFNKEQIYARKLKKKLKTAENEEQTGSMFMGKDPSYPNDLNLLMKPFQCSLCNCNLNSIKSANIHYESKTHDRHITAWIKKNYTDKGIEAPILRRFVINVPNETPTPYHCKLCNVDLSSAQHALQHYNGRRHRNSVSKHSAIDGIGYFGIEGKWIKTGSIIDNETGKESSYILVKTPSGYEPVVLYNATKATNQPKDGSQSENYDLGEPLAKKPHLSESGADNDNTITSSGYPVESEGSTQTPEQALDSKSCKICNISTTSKDQMLLHLKGIRHSKKLKALGELPTQKTILQSLNAYDPEDISIYRTPSGSYYCKFCNVALLEATQMKRHILSKRHAVAAKKAVV